MMQFPYQLLAQEMEGSMQVLHNDAGTATKGDQYARLPHLVRLHGQAACTVAAVRKEEGTLTAAWPV